MLTQKLPTRAAGPNQARELLTQSRAVDTVDPVHLTERVIERLTPPVEGRQLIFDHEVKGLAVRVMASGITSFVLYYRVRGRQRCYTLGRWPEKKLQDARDQAVKLRAAIREGKDPLEEKIIDREAATVKDLGERFLEEYSIPRNRPATLRNNRSALRNIIYPRLGRYRVDAITKRDIQRLHQALHKTPYRANRVRQLCQKMFALAIEWGLRADRQNPAENIEDFHEEPRERWLREDELQRLIKALDHFPNRRAANALRLLILTGSRRSEVLHATWDQFDLERGVWTKPSHHTKQKKTHHLPLNGTALRLLREMHEKSDSSFLFPGAKAGQPLDDLRGPWAQLCKTAKLDGVRIHDLRHTFASHLVTSGTPLAIVGKLLGHTQSQTTEKYAHLADSALRTATDSFAKTVEKAQRGKAKRARRGR